MRRKTTISISELFLDGVFIPLNYKKDFVVVGTSTDPNGVTMVDSIKVFTKTKEAFGWPEEPDEFQEQSAPKPTAAVTAANSANNNNENDVVAPSSSSFTPLPLTSADK